MREAVIQVSHTEFEKLGLDGFISSIRAAGLRDLTELVCYGSWFRLISLETPIIPNIAENGYARPYEYGDILRDSVTHRKRQDVVTTYR